MSVKWSYSSLSLYKQCPHKYYRLKVKKDIKEPPQDHLYYGLRMHKAAEEYVRDDKPLPSEFKFIEEALSTLKNMSGEKHCEIKLGLTANLEACDYYDKNVWWRGIADLLIIDGDVAKLVDYKTGKSAKYADTKQLEILSLAIFKKFPNIKKVKSGLLFVVSNDFVNVDYKPEMQHQLWVKWIEDVDRMQEAYNVDVWNPKPNFTCAKHCAVSDCAHHGKKEW